MAIYRAYVISGPARSSWKDRLRLVAAAVAGIVILASALILSVSLLLVLIPVGLVAYLFRGRILRALFRRAGVEMPTAAAPEPSPRQASDGVIIETDYTVIDRTNDRR
jgi:hypothetical protein